MAVDDFVFSIGLAFGINNWIEEIFHNIQYLQINSIHVRNTREVLRIALARERNLRQHRFLKMLRLRFVWKMFLYVSRGGEANF